MKPQPSSHSFGSKPGTLSEAVADVRSEITRVLLERGDAIVSDSIAVYPYSGPQPLDTDYCERLSRRLLQLFSTSIEGRVAADSDNITDLQRLVTDRSLPVQRLLNFVYLMSALCWTSGARRRNRRTSVRWLIVSQAFARRRSI